MSLIFSGVLLAAFGLSLILITLSLRLLRGANPTGDSGSCAGRFFLICLRVAIGWHCFVEGMEKISAPAWSSEPYLREAMGPLADVYRTAAGDRLIDKLTLGDGDAFPAELEREWREYFDAFAAYYDLDAEQLQRAEEIYRNRKSATLAFLTTKAEPVTKAAAYPPDLILDMTMKERLAEHERLLERVRTAEAKFPSDDKGDQAEWKAAKADLAKWRGELKKAIDGQSAKLKRIDEAARSKAKKNVETLTNILKKSSNAEEKIRLTRVIDGEKEKIWEPLTDVLTSAQKLKNPLPEPIAVPTASWRMQEYADFGVKWALVVLGACLMLGVLSRLSSLATALLVLSFYLAMPPLPGWPEGPRLEGHYLLVNKTLIEVIALLALTFIPTGRWAGLDGLLQFVLPSCCGGACAPIDAPKP